MNNKPKNIPFKLFLKEMLLFISLIFSLQSIKAQDHIGTLDTNSKNGFFNKGYVSGNANQYILRKKDSKVAYTLYGENLNILKEEIVSQKFDAGDILYRSFNGGNLIYLKNKSYYNLNNKEPFSTIKKINEDVNIINSFKSPFGKWKPDLKPIHFMNNNYYLSVGRKSGDEHYKEHWKDTEVFLFKTDLTIGDTQIIPVQKMELTHFYSNSQKLAYANDEFFVLVFNRKFSNKKQSYVVAYYDYEGNLLKSFPMSLQIPEASQSFGYMYLKPDSFNTTQHTWFVPEKDRSFNERSYQKGIPYTQATANSRATWYYSAEEDSFYLYGSIINKKQDDGFKIVKYSNNGERKWEQYQVIENAKFTLGKSINRFITIFETPAFTAFRLYSIKGKHDDHYYLYNRDSGHIIKEDHLEKNEFKNTNYFNSFSALMGVYSEEFKNFTTNFQKTKDKFKSAFFTKEGFVISITDKKENLLNFYKFPY